MTIENILEKRRIKVEKLKTLTHKTGNSGNYLHSASIPNVGSCGDGL